MYLYSKPMIKAIGKRLEELDDDLRVTKKLFYHTKNKQVRKTINNLRYLLIVEKNLLNNPGKDTWDNM